MILAGSSLFPVVSVISEDLPRAIWCGRVAYMDALAWMEKERTERLSRCEPADVIYYLEHDPVITYGRATPPEHLHRRAHDLPIVEVGRGGKATCHGPGQLVGYCMVDLARRAEGRRPDAHEFLRCIERAICAYLNEGVGLGAHVVAGHTGVWVGGIEHPRKICSIGISVRHWIVTHGFALNIAPDLEMFDSIVPCGETEWPMTSVARETGVGLAPLSECARELHPHLRNALRKQGWCVA